MATKTTRGKTTRRARSQTRPIPTSGSRKPNGRRRQSGERLRPGQLDGLVLGYIKKHKRRLPLSPTAVARGIDRSSGAVANCLARLALAEEVRLVENKPRRYGLAEDKR